MTDCALIQNEVVCVISETSSELSAWPQQILGMDLPSLTGMKSFCSSKGKIHAQFYLPDLRDWQESPHFI